jgi:PAS domain S-box-containing protein
MALALNGKWRVGTALARSFALLSMLSSILAVLGYINGVASLYGFASFIPMALHTAALFLTLSMAVLHSAAHFEQNTTALRGVRGQSLQSKVISGFATACFMLAVVSVVAYQSIHQFIEASHWDGHTREVLLAIGDLGSEMKDAETGTRGYVVTGDEIYLDPYRKAVVAVGPMVKELRALTSDNDTQQLRLKQLEPLLQAKLDIDRQIVERRSSVDFDAAQLLPAMGEAKRLMQAIRADLASMESTENDLLAKRSTAQQSSATRTIVVILAVGVCAFVTILVAASRIKRDIRARVAADKALRESEEKFRVLVESAKEYAIMMLDIDGRVRTWNSGAMRIHGYEQEEIVGHYISQFYPSGALPLEKMHELLDQAKEKGEYEEDGWRIRKDGSQFWANIVITCLRDAHGNPVGFSKITRDLTDRKRAEEQTRSFFALSLDMLSIAGTDGFFKHLNPAWRATLGFSEAELRSKPSVEFVHPEDLASTIAMSNRLFHGEAIVNFENRYRRKDGTYRWFAWNATVSEDRQLIYGTARDVTDAKQTEQAIAELNASLRRGNIQLEAANKELEAFSYSVSHDLRAPLRAIDGFSQALLEDYSNQFDDVGKDYLQRVRSATQRMGQLIDDILNLSRVTRSEMSLQRTDLSAIASGIVSELRRSQPDRQIDVEIAGGIDAHADPRLVRIVLDNLIGNAWKFTGKRIDARIEVGVEHGGDETIYFVRDNGAGFDMTYAHKLFGAFQRLHAAADFAGTGIGLATVQRIVHRHGGRVWAESVAGQGATFFFTLPETNPLLNQAA